VYFLPSGLSGSGIHRPVKSRAGVECGHLKEAEWSTKRAGEAILVLSEGCAALRGCGDVL